LYRVILFIVYREAPMAAASAATPPAETPPPVQRSAPGESVGYTGQVGPP
jgi:hypothetical protein